MIVFFRLFKTFIMNKVFKIDNEVVARVTKTEDDLIETRIMRDLRGDEAEIIGVWLMRLLKIVKCINWHLTFSDK